ncbi:MAG TPA: DUF1289 domain-containing protein [Burkholderiales bacterium]|nr:DUF1289 domain-containing protein [Burkholderiales bacterium]
MGGETSESAPAPPRPPAPEAAPTPSPCIGICLLDDNGYCIGCGRTAEQIANLPPEPGDP